MSPSVLHFRIFISLLSLKLALTCLDGECRKLMFPSFFFFADKRLVNHTIRTERVPDLDTCEFRCYNEPNCVSISFNIKASADGTFSCELNNSTHRRHDDEFVDKAGYLYRGTESACDVAHCDNNGICQSGFTEKKYRCLCPSGFTGEECENARNCKDIKERGDSRGDGMYWLDPDEGSNDDEFPAYCDMTSDNGGWTMCYTTDEYAKPKSEVIYSDQFPYGNNGYRTNCNNIQFTEIMFIDHQTGNKAYFKRQDNLAITAAKNYGKTGKAHGLWEGKGTDNTYKYQMLICDHSFYSGFFVSGYTGCFKHCNWWCGDRKSPYFRTASISPSYKGVAFNTNGYRNIVNNRLISVGLR